MATNDTYIISDVEEVISGLNPPTNIVFVDMFPPPEYKWNSIGFQGGETVTLRIYSYKVNREGTRIYSSTYTQTVLKSITQQYQGLYITYTPDPNAEGISALVRYELFPGFVWYNYTAKVLWTDVNYTAQDQAFTTRNPAYIVGGALSIGAVVTPTSSNLSAYQSIYVDGSQIMRIE